uniref:Cytochrome c biogenesis protein CcsA n=1 Tax=Eustigmatophyceae sp. Ndem 8/9T-3m6.8 TaxID=2506146 RepID=A0A410D289_9STRA|nr:heme attachment to plastid cytochrome c [Eustigmatophyceae sp. Ndem 8/9T-3m6.8]QAA11838.1 heme attachment to plastid cytochrome c [Eustigmatophyceae sp. Ndem 8/9T-3m6.8]
MEWKSFEHLLQSIIFYSLCGSTLLTFFTLIMKDKESVALKLSVLLSDLSTVFFVVLLSGRWITGKYFPLSNLYESLLFLCTAILLVQKWAERKMLSRLISSMVLPVVVLIFRFATNILPSEMQNITSLAPSLQSNWLMMHVSIMMVSYASLIVGSLLSILLLVLSFKKSPIQKLSSSIIEDKTSEVSFPSFNIDNTTTITNPPVTRSINELLDIWSYRLIAFGFPCLTLGIISGAVWANQAWGSYWSWDPKESWALITWLVFAIYLHSRLIKGWQGKRPAILATIGFFIVWMCYLGVNFLGQGLHSYGWLE